MWRKRDLPHLVCVANSANYTLMEHQSLRECQRGIFHGLKAQSASWLDGTSTLMNELPHIAEIFFARFRKLFSAWRTNYLPSRIQRGLMIYADALCALTQWRTPRLKHTSNRFCDNSTLRMTALTVRAMAALGSSSSPKDLSFLAALTISSTRWLVAFNFYVCSCGSDQWISAGMCQAVFRFANCHYCRSEPPSPTFWRKKKRRVEQALFDSRILCLRLAVHRRFGVAGGDLSLCGLKVLFNSVSACLLNWSFPTENKSLIQSLSLVVERPRGVLSSHSVPGWTVPAQLLGDLAQTPWGRADEEHAIAGVLLALSSYPDSFSVRHATVFASMLSRSLSVLEDVLRLKHVMSAVHSGIQPALRRLTVGINVSIQHQQIAKLREDSPQDALPQALRLFCRLLFLCKSAKNMTSRGLICQAIQHSLDTQHRRGTRRLRKVYRAKRFSSAG